MYIKKVQVHENRKEFRRQNNFYEFNRKLFYRKLHGGEKLPGTQSDEDMAGFWNKVWRKRSVDNTDKYPEIILPKPLLFESNTGIIDLEGKLKRIISFLPNWKTPGPDKVFNFFIKNCHALHKYVVALADEVINNPNLIPAWMFVGTTYLLPKTDFPGSPAEYRPITCMNNLYKVITKLVAQEMRDFVEANQILSHNQLGTVRNCQGAKEQALINKNLSFNFNNKLSTMWIDVKKLYDSVDHEYL